MTSFKAYIKKEIIEGLRSYRYLVLLLSMVIFAILDPLMLKLLPVLIGGQLPEGVIQLFKITQTFAVQNYIKDFSQIINIVIILTLMGLMVDERQNKTLVFPYSKGVSVTGMIIGKNIAYSVALPLCIFIGFCTNYYYSSILFSEDPVNILNILKVAGLFSIYYIFIVSLLIFLGSLSQRKLFVGISSLGIVFLLSVLGNIDILRDFLPSNLISLAGNIITGVPSSKFGIGSMLVTIGSVVLYIGIFNMLAVIRMKKVEIL